jgi:hypothetical protein
VWGDGIVERVVASNTEAVEVELEEELVPLVGVVIVIN